MVNRHSRDFITGYKLDNNNIIVTLGTGEKIIYPIEERNRIKLAIEKEISDLNKTKIKAMQKCKQKKYESYLNVAIVVSSLTTLGSINPSIVPIVSLSAVAGANGILYFINQNKSKEYDKIAKDESINNTIYDLQTNQKEAESNTTEKVTTKQTAQIVDISRNFEEENSYEEETIRKVA